MRSSTAHASRQRLIQATLFRRLASSSSGFTLIEMVAVIAIIGMIFAIGIPRLSTSKIRALRNDAESIAASLEYARQRAIMTRIPHRVLFDLEDGGYRIEWLVDEAHADEAVADADHELATADPETPAADASNPDAAHIDFHPPAREERNFYPIANRQLGSFTWLDDARYFVGLENSSGWIEGGEVEIVFDEEGATEHTLLELADADDNHLTLEVEPLLDRVRQRAGAARS